MTPDELGQRVHNDVRSVLKWLQHHRSRHRVVNDEGHAGTMSDIRDGFKVNHISGRVSNRLQEDATRTIINQRGNRLRAIIDREARFNSQRG